MSCVMWNGYNVNSLCFTLHNRHGEEEPDTLFQQRQIKVNCLKVVHPKQCKGHQNTPVISHLLKQKVSSQLILQSIQALFYVNLSADAMPLSVIHQIQMSYHLKLVSLNKGQPKQHVPSVLSSSHNLIYSWSKVLQSWGRCYSCWVKHKLRRMVCIIPPKYVISAWPQSERVWLRVSKPASDGGEKTHVEEYWWRMKEKKRRKNNAEWSKWLALMNHNHESQQYGQVCQ